MDYNGVYRGIAISDPDDFSRIEVRCPLLTGENSLGKAWPLDSRDVVRRGEGVWIMFEAGDCRYPIWFGRWNTDE